MKLTYWYAKHLTDSDCYSIIGRTKKAALEEVARANEWRDAVGGERNFAPPEKRVVHYASAFDLLDQATQEGGGRGCGHAS